MKKWLRYGVALAVIPALSLGRFGGRDVGKLQPVQVVMLQWENGKLRLLTDTEALGQGEDVSKAVEDMNKSADAWVYLDTADYLLLGEGTRQWLPQLQEYLRPSCCLCSVAGQIDMAKAGTFLKLHEPELTLARYEAGDRELPRLISEEGRLKLVQE